MFTRFSSRYARLLASQNVPVYYFLFDYQGSNSIMHTLGVTETQHVAHGDILQYLFSGILGEERNLPPEDEEFARKTLLPLYNKLRFIINFAKSSNPTPTKFQGVTWPKFNEADQAVLSVGTELAVKTKFRTNILRYWDEELPKIISGKKKEEL